MQDELQINLGPSAYIKWAFIVQHIGGLICVAYTIFPKYLLILSSSLLIVWHLRYCIKKYVYHNDRLSIVRFSLKPSGQGTFYMQKNLAMQGTILPGISYSSQFIIILAIRSKMSKMRYVVVCKDSIPHFAYQRLLAHMRAIPQIDKVFAV